MGQLSQNLINNCIRISQNLYDAIPSTRKHTSFIVRRTSIISIGYNLSFCTHPLAAKYGYRFHAIHSELKAILNFDGKIADLRRHKIINVRLDINRKVKMSKPCKICQLLLIDFGISEIWYSNNSQLFERM